MVLNMTTIFNDFKPEVRSLIHRLQKAGFAIEGCDNGEGGFYSYSRAVRDYKEFIKELTATDETWLYITRDGFQFSLFLVLGNSPGELVCDYTYKSKAVGTQTLADLDAITMAHYDSWIDRKQPTEIK
jgi:hypothetical protein